jgi:hypothetical protein
MERYKNDFRCQELPDAKVVHQAQLIVGVGIPGAVDFQWAARLARVGVTQVGADRSWASASAGR